MCVRLNVNYSGVKKFFDENKEYSILTEGVTDKHIKEIEKISK